MEDRPYETWDVKTNRWVVLPGWIDRSDGSYDEVELLSTADIVEECGG